MTPAKYLLCTDAEQAAILDALICEHIREVDGNKGSSWSGLNEKDDGTVALVWEPCLIPFLGDPAKEPELVIESAVLSTKTVEGKPQLVSNWKEVLPVAEPVKDAEPAPVKGATVGTK